MARYVDLSNPKIFHIGRDKYGNGIYHIPPDLPTDDVVERKKGKWIEEPNCWYRCSLCGEHYVGLTFGLKYPSLQGCMDYNYCPNCGADMRERKEE